MYTYQNYKYYSFNYQQNFNAREASVLSVPDILKSVTLEEIIQAVDIVAEQEEEDRRNQEAKEQQWNIGILEDHKGPIFLQGLEGHLDDT